VSAVLEIAVDLNEPDYSGRTALFRAIESGDHSVARLLLESASDPNYKDMWGNTALHHAVQANSETLALLLLEYGAHINP
jgi:ankyrin repeat protein